MEHPARFELPQPITVPDSTLHRLRLEPVGAQQPDVDSVGGGTTFTAAGWFEVLLTVAWDPTNGIGRRFAHTAVPDQHPLHSEAIEASILTSLSDGEQLLRGNTVFTPGGVDTIMLEVWHDSGNPLQVRRASLVVRPLADAT